MLTEFGGISQTEPDAAAGTWGCGRAASAEDLLERYARLLAAVHAIPKLAGFCYTQLTDTYQEANGLLRMDRTPKAPLARLARATHGGIHPEEALRGADPDVQAGFGGE